MLKMIANLFKQNYENLNGFEFKEKYNENKNSILLDVRTSGEFKSGTIKGSKNLNVMGPSFLSEIDKLNKELSYFVFCRSGARSASAANIMSKKGYVVYNLSGGIGAWPR